MEDNNVSISHTNILENTSNNSINYVKWNDKLENSAKNIGESAKGYKLMHLAEAQKANKIYNRLMIAGIILGPLSGLLTSIETSLHPEEMKTSLPILATVCGFISGIIVAIVKFGKYDEESTHNKQAAARYTSIESNVRRQLSLYRRDRTPARAYMEWLELKYEELFLSAPLLPAKAYDNYYSIAKKLNLNVPNQYEATISINTENDDNNTKLNNNTDININDVNFVVNDKNNTKLNNNTDININDASFVVNNKNNRQNNNTFVNINSIIHEEQNNKSNIEDRSTSSSETRIQTRKNIVNQLPHLNQYSDKMLEYELKRMIGFQNSQKNLAN